MQSVTPAVRISTASIYYSTLTGPHFRDALGRTHPVTLTAIEDDFGPSAMAEILCRPGQRVAITLPDHLNQQLPIAA
jgi:hypothetical protein